MRKTRLFLLKLLFSATEELAEEKKCCRTSKRASEGQVIVGNTRTPSCPRYSSVHHFTLMNHLEDRFTRKHVKNSAAAAAAAVACLPLPACRSRAEC